MKKNQKSKEEMAREIVPKLTEKKKKKIIERYK